MRAAIISICSTLALIAACSGGAGTATSLRGGPDGIPNSSTDNPGNGYEDPGKSNQDQPGASNQDSPGGGSANPACLSCSGVYSCTIAGQQNGTSLIGLVPADNGCGVISQQGGKSTGTLQCGGTIDITSDNTTGAVETWSGGNGSFTVTASDSGQTIVITCVSTNATLPTGATQVTGSGGPDAG